MKIYIGSAVQGLNDSEYQKMTGRIRWLGKELITRGHEILSYKSMSDRKSTPAEIYEHDHKNCMECDAMIALALNPSTGLGMEMITCLSRIRYGQSHPALVLAIADANTNVSKLLVGWKHPRFKFARYQEFEEIPEIFEKFCASVR